MADLATEKALDDKLLAASLAKREREKGKPPIATQIREQIARVVPDATPRDQIVGRIPVEEGERLEVPPNVRAAIVPPRFTGVSFDSYEPATRGQQTALSAARFWADRARKGECAMVALIGPQGTGKSHLLYAAANALLSYGVRCYARPWYRLADELRYGGESPFVANKQMEAYEVRALLWKQKVVLIDEVRPTASTAFDDTELAKWVCQAYDAKYAVFITTNVNPLADVLGPPAASRFTQIVIDGPDRRQA